MLERILVPLDGSATAEAILPLVRRLLRRGDSEVILLRAANPPPTEDYFSMYEASLAAAREYLLGIRDRLEEQGAKVKAIARIGPPTGAILDAAEEEKATLIALATHGRTGLARALLGSVAEEVIRQSPVPIIVVRPFWTYEVKAGRTEEQPIKNILIPFDGSELSLGVVPQAIQFANLFEARVILLNVMGPQASWARRPKEGLKVKTDREIAEGRLKEIAARFQSAGVSALPLVDQGDPVSVILKTCRFHGIDLIAMTTHGRTGLGRLALGSVTEGVLREATVPMMIARAAKAAAKKTPKKAVAVKGKQ